MTAARDDDFMALLGMEADSTDAHHGRERLSGDTAPTSSNTSPNASSKSALDALLDEDRARAKSEREKGTLFEELNIEKVHPHKFRRTLATKAIDKGMPVEQLQHLLGHQRIDTTLQYAMVRQTNVKNAHRRYIG